MWLGLRNAGIHDLCSGRPCSLIGNRYIFLPYSDSLWLLCYKKTPANTRRWPNVGLMLTHCQNTRRWPNVGQMLGQRLRWWANISPTLGQRLVFAWTSSAPMGLQVYSHTHSHRRPINNLDRGLNFELDLYRTNRVSEILISSHF